MDRNEAMLRELHLYPQWKRRDQPAPDVEEQVPVENVQAVNAPNENIQVENTQAVVNESQAAPVEVIEAPEKVQPVAPVPVETTPVATPAPAAQPTSQVGKLNWSQLKDTVKECHDCKLRAGCMQTVFGVGDEKADWLFVGEGPGADEDALGEPFVGQAGKLLDNMLMAIKLKRGQNAYIANVVKCRPPNNRNPNSSEIATCMPYLQRQIQLIQPKLIIALGKVASNTLLGKDATLASLRGKVHDCNGIPLIVTYHPAYLLRSPSEKAKVWKDLRLAVQQFN